jgi:hypothetical protein
MLYAKRRDTISVIEAADILQCSAASVLNWINAGEILGAFKLNPLRKNSHYRIPRTSVYTFMARRESKDEQ